MWRLGEPIRQPLPSPAPQRETSSIEGNYIIMPRASTYALGIQVLQEACKTEMDSPHPQFVLDDGNKIYRALTFKEDIEARVKDYENNKGTEERVRLFKTWNDSCTGVAYKGGTTKFKIVPICSGLITINKDFNGGGLAIDYDAIKGVEVDRAVGKYNVHLTKDEVLVNEGWRAAVEGDIELLTAYRDIVFTELKGAGAMAFCVLDKPAQDQLRALFVYSLNYDSFASGSSNLSSNGSFLHVAPSRAREM